MSLTISFNDLDFTDATPVQCVVNKFIFPIGTFEGEDGGVDLINPDTGERITDKYNPRLTPTSKGFVRKNRSESISYAIADGQSTMILNKVTEADAQLLLAKIDEMGGDTRKFTLAQIDALLDYAEDLGYTDSYSSDLDFHGQKFASTNTLTTEIPGFSFGRRNDRIEGQTVVGIFVEGEDVTFVGQAQAAGNEQKHANGLLAVFDAAANEGDQYRSIDAKELPTYALANVDATPIVPGQNIKTVKAAELKL